MTHTNVVKRDISGSFVRPQGEEVSLRSTPSGTVEIFKGGQRVSTTSADVAEQQARRLGGTFVGFQGPQAPPTTPQAPLGDVTPPTGGIAPEGQLPPTGGVEEPTPGQAPNQIDTFNSLLLDVLKRSQGIDTTELKKKQRALQRAAIGRQAEITPEELRTLSPAQQNAIRTGDINALIPDIDETAFKLSQSKQRIENFERIFDQAREISEDFAEKIVADDDTIRSFADLIESGESISAILGNVNDKTRTAVLKAIDPLKIQEAEITRARGLAEAKREPTAPVRQPTPLGPTENIFDLGIEAGEGDVITRGGRQFRVDPAGDLIPVDAGGDLGALTPFEAQGLEFRLGRQAFGSRISDKEGEKVSKFVQAGIDAGKNENDILDTILGFNVKKNEELGRTLQNTLVGFGAENGLSDFDMVGLARLLNSDNTVGAMTKVENSGMKEAKELNPDGFISEGVVVAATDRSNNIRDLVQELEGLGQSPVGVVSGTMETWLGRLRGKEATAIGTKIVSAVAEMRKRLLGSAVTPSENVFLAPKVPILGDNPENFIIKLQELSSDPLLQLNSVRGTVQLPQLTEDTLLDKNQRVNLYTGEEVSEEEDDIDSFLDRI